MTMQTERLIPWFGANTANAWRVGQLLEGCAYVAIPFVGGFCEVPHITARQIVVNDKHANAINLARIIATPHGVSRLFKVLDRLPVCDAIRDEAIAEIRANAFDDEIQCAAAYFVSQWMGRSAQSGTPREFSGKVPVRTNANGGGTNQRYRTAVRALPEWHATLKRCDFTTLDWHEFLETYGRDEEGHGIYSDAPWPDAGDAYTHSLDEVQQGRLAGKLTTYRRARVVIRYGDHPLIRELYDDPRWTIQECSGRKQSNAAQRELLILNEAAVNSLQDACTQQPSAALF